MEKFDEFEVWFSFEGVEFYMILMFSYILSDEFWGLYEVGGRRFVCRWCRQRRGI